MSSPNSAELSRSRDFFRHLLERRTTERDWQTFFSDHPYVLSRSLPIRLEPRDILTLGRPGHTEPDFAFYPRGIHPIPYYGVIELKRPDSPIASFPRANVAILTRDAETAVQQVRAYAKPPCQFLPEELNERPLFLGNQAYLFVIMGMSSEMSSKSFGVDIYREMIESRLPPNLQLLPYDTLLRRFESGLSPRLFVLRAGEPEVKTEPEPPLVAERPIELRDSDECTYDIDGHCDNQFHWGANE
jgi:hypothetical protein